ncbi:hypothetical protein J3F84DRAFT_90486 [Trichoderma pleuroticola]
MDSEQMQTEYAQLQSATTLENPMLNNIVVACCRIIPPAHLSTISVLLPAIAYPFLSPRAAHGLLVYSFFFLNSHALTIQHDLWKVGETYTDIPYWKSAFASFCLAVGMVGLARGKYRATQPRHTFLLGVIPWLFTSLTSWILYVFVTLLEEQRKDSPASHEARLKKFCTISPIVATLVCFKSLVD